MKIRSRMIVEIGSSYQFLPLLHARVKDRVDQIGDEISPHYCQGNQQENSLQQRIVRVLRCLEKGETNARIRENYLGQERAADDKAQGKSETSHIRQDGIACSVRKHDATFTQPLGFRQ